MRTANCPSCGGPLRFRGATSIVAVCAFCRSTLVREGAKLEDIGKQAELLEDHSPIRIGASGKHRGASFDVVGRIQYRYGAGLWNEWHVLFSDGKSGWLSDANRQYTITYLVAPQKVPKFEDLKPGAGLTLGRDNYVAVNMEAAEVVAGEGELPFKFLSGWKANVADLRGDGTKFATIDYSEGVPLIYTGERLPFDTFGFSGLRDPEAIGFAKGRALAFKCGGCGAPVESRLTTSEVVACGSCGTVTDVSKGVGEIVQKQEQVRKKLKTTLPLGAIGTYKNVKYEVVGVMRRRIEVGGEHYSWIEHLLHNVERGYAWVSEYNGHFSFIQDASEVPKPKRGLSFKPRMAYLGRTFEHFQKSRPTVTYLDGEFHWRVKVDDMCQCNDYVAPPLILSSESTDNEITWSLGEYVEAPALWKAFALKGKPPLPEGVAPNQPSPHAGKVLPYWLAFLAFLVVGILAQILIMGGQRVDRPKPVAFVATPGDTSQTVSSVFELGGWGSSPVTLSANSNAGNTWLMLDYKLVEVDTGRAFGTKAQLGYSLVGSVMDGSTNDVTEIASVPPGRYTLAIEAKAGVVPGRATQPRITGDVSVYREGAGFFNFLMLLAFLFMWPFIAWRQNRNFESRRWAESDYAPASADDDD